MEQLEKDIEKGFGEKLSAWSYENGFNVVYVKFTGAKGWPDRIITWGEGVPHMIWVEWKRPGERLRPLQAHVHKILQAMGHEVRVYDDARIALDEVKEAIRASSRTSSWDEVDSERGRCEVVPSARKGKDLSSPKGVQRSKTPGDGRLPRSPRSSKGCDN